MAALAPPPDDTWGNADASAFPDAKAESDAYVDRLTRRLASLSTGGVRLPRGVTVEALADPSNAAGMRVLAMELSRANAHPPDALAGAGGGGAGQQSPHATALPPVAQHASAGGGAAGEDAIARASLLRGAGGGEGDGDGVDDAYGALGGGGERPPAGRRTARGDAVAVDVGAGTGLFGSGPPRSGRRADVASARGGARGHPRGRGNGVADTAPARAAPFPFASAGEFCAALGRDPLGALIDLADGASRVLGAWLEAAGAALERAVAGGGDEEERGALVEAGAAAAVEPPARADDGEAGREHAPQAAP